jgi:hypothetical protein
MKMFPKVITGAIGVASALVLTSSTASANLLTDPGFDLGLYTPQPIQPATVGAGWAAINGTGPGTSQGSSSAQFLSSPNSYLVTMGAGDAWDFTGPYQAVGLGVNGVTIIPGQTYTANVSFLTTTGFGEGIAGNSGNAAVGAYLQIQFNSNAANLPQVGATASINNTGVGLSTGTWYNETISAVAPAGAQVAEVYLALMDDGTQTAAQTVYFDNASLTTVPEPSILALLGMGLSLPFYFLRRRSS